MLAIVNQKKARFQAEVIDDGSVSDYSISDGSASTRHSRRRSSKLHQHRVGPSPTTHRHAKVRPPTRHSTGNALSISFPNQMDYNHGTRQPGVLVAPSPQYTTTAITTFSQPAEDSSMEERAINSTHLSAPPLPTNILTTFAQQHDQDIATLRNKIETLKLDQVNANVTITTLQQTTQSMVLMMTEFIPVIRQLQETLASPPFHPAPDPHHPPLPLTDSPMPYPQPGKASQSGQDK